MQTLTIESRRIAGWLAGCYAGARRMLAVEVVASTAAAAKLSFAIAKVSLERYGSLVALPSPALTDGTHPVPVVAANVALLPLWQVMWNCQRNMNLHFSPVHNLLTINCNVFYFSNFFSFILIALLLCALAFCIRLLCVSCRAARLFNFIWKVCTFRLSQCFMLLLLVFFFLYKIRFLSYFAQIKKLLRCCNAINALRWKPVRMWGNRRNHWNQGVKEWQEDSEFRAK